MGRTNEQTNDARLPVAAGRPGRGAAPRAALLQNAAAESRCMAKLTLPLDTAAAAASTLVDYYTDIYTSLMRVLVNTSTVHALVLPR